MDVNRRDFLKTAGVAALLGLGGKAAVDVLAPGRVDASMAAVPLTEGKRWAMVIDTRKMDEHLMETCARACHREHNVPEWGNAKHAVKWIWMEPYENAFPDSPNAFMAEKVEEKPFLVLCNHCYNPPCVRVCPTQATWKRPEDGIVMMDLHRCIGCRFCMAACPFGSRSFNWGDPKAAPKELNPDFPTNRDYPLRSKGVVEKCTFCDQRIAQGKLPACVEAANEIQEGALLFGDLADPESNVRKALREHYSIRRKAELGTEPNVFYIV